MSNSIVALASAARTASAVSAPIITKGLSAAYVILDVTAYPSTASITLTVQGYNPATSSWYTLLTGAAVSSVSNTTYKVSPHLAAAANSVAKDHIPENIRISVAAANAESITYSVAVNLCG